MDLHHEICPGELPKGAECQAKLKSDESHKFQLPTNDDKESDYIKILLSILDILEHDNDFADGFPIIFTEGGTKSLPEQKLLINSRRSMVKIMEESSEYKIASDLQIYPLSMLVYYLDKVISKAHRKDEHFKSIDEAHVNLDFAMHDYEVTTEGCVFHNELDAKKNCCLSKVRRFCYALAKLFSNPRKYPFIEGKHYPVGYNVFDRQNNNKN